MRFILDCGCVIVNSTRHWCPSCQSPRPSDPKPRKKIGADPKHLQSEEYNRLYDLCRAFNLIPLTIDPEYPTRICNYEAYLEKFIEALRDNGRIL